MGSCREWEWPFGAGHSVQLLPRMGSCREWEWPFGGSHSGQLLPKTVDFDTKTIDFGPKVVANGKLLRMGTAIRNKSFATTFTTNGLSLEVIRWNFWPKSTTCQAHSPGPLTMQTQGDFWSECMVRDKFDQNHTFSHIFLIRNLPLKSDPIWHFKMANRKCVGEPPQVYRDLIMAPLAGVRKLLT